jgi:hypothetical protein
MEGPFFARLRKSYYVIAYVITHAIANVLATVLAIT